MVFSVVLRSGGLLHASHQCLLNGEEIWISATRNHLHTAISCKLLREVSDNRIQPMWRPPQLVWMWPANRAKKRVRFRLIGQSLPYSSRKRAIIVHSAQSIPGLVSFSLPQLFRAIKGSMKSICFFFISFCFFLFFFVELRGKRFLSRTLMKSTLLIK